MDIASMRLNRSRNMFVSPISPKHTSPTGDALHLQRRHSSVYLKNGGPQDVRKQEARKSFSCTGMNEITSSPDLETMSTEQLRQLIGQLTKDLQDVQNEVRNATAENLNLKHQLQCRMKLHQSAEQMHSSSLRRNTIDASSFASVIPFECDESLVEHVDRTNYDDNNELMFLVPENLKQEEPSRISVFLSQSMTVLAHINNQEVMEKVCVGSQIAKQLTLGGAAGYFTSHLVRKFGKIAAGSIIGSICFIKLAHHRGYIAVDWSRIQKQIENPHEGDEGDNPACNVDNDIAWLSSKYQKIHQWSRENSYTVLGFWTGLLAHNFYS